MKESKHCNQCEQLLEMATPELYRRNLFRVLGLPLDATSKEMQRREKLRKMQEKLGVAASANGGGFFPLDPPPGDADTRLAMERLNSPLHRLLDEIFWFWPMNSDASEDPALAALEKGEAEVACKIWKKHKKPAQQHMIAMHNLAVLYHLRALDYEAMMISGEVKPKEQGLLMSFWTDALESWQKVIANKIFWDRIRKRVTEVDDVTLTIDVVERVHNTFLKALLVINGKIACAAADKSCPDIAGYHVRLLRNSKAPRQLIEKVIYEVLDPIRNRITLMCDDAIKDAKAEPWKADQIGSTFAFEAEKLLAVVNHLLDHNDTLYTSISDQVADTINRCGIMYFNEVSDVNQSIAIVERSIGIACSGSVRGRLSKDLNDLRQFAGNDWCFFCGKPSHYDSNVKMLFQRPSYSNNFRPGLLFEREPVQDLFRGFDPNTNRLVTIGRCKRCAWRQAVFVKLMKICKFSTPLMRFVARPFRDHFRPVEEHPEVRALEADGWSCQ